MNTPNKNSSDSTPRSQSHVVDIANNETILTPKHETNICRKIS